jgi:rhodanese-related sulfurtransferase
MTTTTQIRELDPASARQRLEARDAIMVDVREPDEHAREHIEGATLIPLSRFDPAQVPPGTPVIMQCRSGNRSREAAIRLIQARADAAVFNLAGGIEAWRKAGLPTRVNRKAPIPIMRQVQIAAGSLVVVGTILGAAVSPWFLIVPGFVGAGLVFAGTTGMCGMARMLTIMPWNRASC